MAYGTIFVVSIKRRMGAVRGGACYTLLTAIVASGAARRVVLYDLRVIHNCIGEIRRIVTEIAILGR